MNKSEVPGAQGPRKTFDFADHAILVKKRTHYFILKTQILYICLCHIYLDNKMQCVLLHGSYSSEDSVKFGVPQASIFGPSCLDFLLFLNLLLMTFHYATCWPMTQHCTHLEKTLYKPEAILYKTA